MAGANDVLRILGAVLGFFVVIFVMGVGVTLMDAIGPKMSAHTGLGWSDPDYDFFMGLGLVGLLFVITVWLIWGAIRQDVRQETRPRP